MSQSQKFQSTHTGNVYSMLPWVAAKLGGLHPVIEEVVVQPPTKPDKAQPKKNSSKEGK